MERGDDPVEAIENVLPKTVKIKPSVKSDLGKMFVKASGHTKTGSVQTRETLIYFLDRFRNYPGKINKDQKPPDPWGA
jgi:hypothetical protein